MSLVHTLSDDLSFFEHTHSLLFERTLEDDVKLNQRIVTHLVLVSRIIYSTKMCSCLFFCVSPYKENSLKMEVVSFSRDFSEM
jgi:hypothetical protein